MVENHEALKESLLQSAKSFLQYFLTFLGRHIFKFQDILTRKYLDPALI